MDLLGGTAEPLEQALPAIGQRSFPGLSAHDVDAFTLGYWAGAMAHALATSDEAISADEIAGRLEAEYERIASDGDDAS